MQPTPGVELPCGERITADEIDLGMREIACSCGATHAVVTDAHPLDRFLPPFLVETLRETVEPADDHRFDAPHLAGMVLEEFPDRTATLDTGDAGDVGYATVWITDFDARRLHEVIVELVVELMEHAVSHSDDTDAVAAFERRMREFDVREFVDSYRAQRDLDADDVRP